MEETSILVRIQKMTGRHRGIPEYLGTQWHKANPPLRIKFQEWKPGDINEAEERRSVNLLRHVFQGVVETACA